MVITTFVLIPMVFKVILNVALNRNIFYVPGEINEQPTKGESPLLESQEAEV